MAGFNNPIALIPNGVEIPPTLPRQKETGRRGRVLFLSRIHPKKGLRVLIEAWDQLAPTGWDLVIAGPDEGGHLAEVRSAVRKCNLEQKVKFPGEVWGPEKNQLYFDADLFVLPSLSENFGLVIAEALSCGVPVITTKATPWEELETHRCGWWVETGTQPLVEALRVALSLPREELREMGMRGRKLIQEKYAWGPIGQQMGEVYLWMLGMRPPPECVLFRE